MQIVEDDSDNSNSNSNSNSKKDINTTDSREGDNGTKLNSEKLVKFLPLRAARVKLVELNRFVAQNSRRQLMIAWSLIEYQVRALTNSMMIHVINCYYYSSSFSDNEIFTLIIFS